MSTKLTPAEIDAQIKKEQIEKENKEKLKALQKEQIIKK